MDTFHSLFTGKQKAHLKISLWSCRWAEEPETKLAGLVCTAPFWMWKWSETFCFVSSSVSYAATLLQLFGKLFFLISEGSQRIQINNIWSQTCGAHMLHHWHDRIYWWITEDCWNVLINCDAVNDVLKWWKPAFVVSSVHQDLQVWLAHCQLQVWGLLWRLSATSKVWLYLKSFMFVCPVFTQVPIHVYSGHVRTAAVCNTWVPEV